MFHANSRNEKNCLRIEKVNRPAVSTIYCHYGVHSGVYRTDYYAI